MEKIIIRHSFCKHVMFLHKDLICQQNYQGFEKGSQSYKNENRKIVNFVFRFQGRLL